MLSVSVDWPFLYTPSVLSNVYEQNRQNKLKKNSVTQFISSIIFKIRYYGQYKKTKHAIWEDIDIFYYVFYTCRS